MWLVPGEGCRYKAGESLAALARTVELPPCLLVRRFLEFNPKAYCLVSAIQLVYSLASFPPSYFDDMAHSFGLLCAVCRKSLGCQGTNTGVPDVAARGVAFSLCLQKGTHVLRNPKLLEGLSQSRQTDAEHVAAGQKPDMRQDHGEQQGAFKALMTRLQADIVEASEQDTISSPQADLMRSVVGMRTSSADDSLAYIGRQI